MLGPGSSYSSRISKWGLMLVCMCDVCWFYTQTVFWIKNIKVWYTQQDKGLRSAHVQVWIPTLLDARCVFLGTLLNFSPGTDFVICLTEATFHCFVEIQWDIDISHLAEPGPWHFGNHSSIAYLLSIYSMQALFWPWRLSNNREKPAPSSLLILHISSITRIPEELCTPVNMQQSGGRTNLPSAIIFQSHRSAQEVHLQVRSGWLPRVLPPRPRGPAATASRQAVHLGSERRGSNPYSGLQGLGRSRI